MINNQHKDRYNCLLRYYYYYQDIIDYNVFLIDKIKEEENEKKAYVNTNLGADLCNVFAGMHNKSTRSDNSK